MIRYCCQYLKEGAGANSVVITGIRKAESYKRSKRNEMEVSNRKYSNTLDQFNIDFENKTICVKGKDKVILNPIIDWSDRDVWAFIHSNKLEYCKLYDDGYKRIGCILCPMTSVKSKQIDRQRYPRIEAKIKKSIKVLVESNNYGSDLQGDVDEIFNWWVSGRSMKGYKLSSAQFKIKFPE